MKDPIPDEEHEPLDTVSRVQLVVAACCVALSAACGVLWIAMLLAPRVSH